MKPKTPVIPQTPSRPKVSSEMDRVRDSKVKLKIGNIALRKPKKLKFNEVFDVKK